MLVKILDIYKDIFHNKKKTWVNSCSRSASPLIFPKENSVLLEKDQNVSRILKGIFQLRPTLSKYVAFQHITRHNTEMYAFLSR